MPCSSATWATGIPSSLILFNIWALTSLLTGDLGIWIIPFFIHYTGEDSAYKFWGTWHTNADSTLQADRAKWASNRQAIYAKLTAKATTPAEQQAVATFQSTIEA